MPQFDKITFFTQIFWLILLFFGSYFLILKAFLPKVASVLKSRTKKLFLTSSRASSLDKEHILTNSTRNNFLEDFTLKMRTDLSSKRLSSIGWLTTFTLRFAKQELKLSQEKYLETHKNTFIMYYLGIKNLESKLIS